MESSAKLQTKRVWKFILIDSLFEGGRMFVGAISIIYLISMGVSLQRVALLKMVQGVVLFFGEIPTGVLADTLGRSRSLIVACTCAIIGFSLYIVSNSFHFYLIAEVFTALSLCFWSGAYEAFCIDSCGLKGGEIYQFFSMNSAIGGVFVLFSGFLGAIAGDYGLTIPYILGIISFIFTVVLIIYIRNHVEDIKVPLRTVPQIITQFNMHFTSAFKEGIMQPSLVPFFVIGIVSQFLIQPILHYWQPLFQSTDTSFSAHDTGVVFFSYCLASMVFNYVYSKLSVKKMFRSPFAILVMYSIASLLYLTIAMAHGYLSLLILFSALQGMMSVGGSSLGSKLNENIDSQSRASILSSFSMFSRIGMIVSLFTIPIVIGQYAPGKQVGVLFFTYSLSAMFACVLIGALVIMRKLPQKYQRDTLVLNK